MSKNGTLALSLITLFVMTTPPASAEVDCTPYIKGYVEALNKSQPNQQVIDRLARDRDECLRKQTSQVGECKSNAEAEYTKAVKDLQDACDSMGLRSSARTGTIGCSYNIEQCRCAAKGLKDTEKHYLGCDGVDVSKLKYCPQVTEAMQERMEKRREKAQDRLEKAREKLRSLEDEQGRGTKEASSAASKAREARAAAQKEYAQGVAEAKREKNQKEQERIQKMSEYEEKMQTAQTALRARELKDRNAGRKLEAAKAQIYIGCVNQAQAAVNALQTDAVNNARQGTYNRGMQNDIFRQVGLTDRQSWQREVNKRVRWCMASPETATQQTLANQQLDAEKDGNRTEAEDARAQLEMLKKQMQLIQAACTGNAVAANGEVVQSQACRDQQDNNEKMKALGESRQAALEAAEADLAEAQSAAYMAQTTAMNKTASLLADINGEEDLIRNLDEADKANASYPGSTTSEERAKTLSSKFAATIDEAIQVKACCARSGNTLSSQTCSSAKGFLEGLGRTTESASTASLATSPPPSSGTSTGQ